MDEIYVKARAKINLNLEVLDKRKDNYHNIKSIFQKINLYDEMYIKKTNTNKFELQTNEKSIENKENIIYKAFEKLKEKYNVISGIQVKLNKKIPMQAGLGGGSTDCASFILCMNKLFNLKLTKTEIESIGKSLGADVVPCLYNRALLAEGIGDKITTINTNFKYYIVIIKLDILGNTKDMYSRIDKKQKLIKIDNTNKIIEGLENNNIELIAKNLHNTFEDVVQEKDVVENIKKEFIKNGAQGSLMTGSGACFYGIFEDKKVAKNVYNKLKDKYQTYICTSYNSKKGEEF